MKKIFTLCVVLCLSYLTMGASTPKHEFRATWLATVSGIDWPKTKATNDATREQQKQELIDILDKMKAGNLNAVCFQVRSLCDAMYQSSYEPWSIALTGTRGKDPGYDPLQFAIDEAHKRGMELHVWVNPFRASTSTLAATDMLWDNAGDWLIKYNNSSFSGYLIDPGYPESRAYVVKVLMEIINNYDVDGLVMDDYFYAYGGTTNQDSVAQALHYRASEVIDVNNNGNKIDDWRRSNVDNVIKAMYDSIQVVKPWVRFGMGPGGIWSMDKNAAKTYGLTLPSGIKGSDPYTELYCNTVEWVKQGWVDYVNPQIYWSTQVAAQDYDVLCQWWSTSVCEHFSNQLPNQKRVHHFPSLATYKAIQKNDGTYYSGYSDGYVEIQRELDANRKNLSSGYTGAVFYNTTSYLQMSEELAESHFTHTALAPPMEWKVKGDLAAPTNLQLSGTTLSWQHPTAERFTVYAYPKGIGVNTATSNPQYLQAVVYDKSFNTSSIGSLDDITIAVYTYDRYGVEHGVALYNADPNATDDPEPEPEPEPEPSNTITWELNGGEVNTSSIEVPSQSDLMLQFMNNYTSYFGTLTSDIDAFYPSNISGFLYRGFQTRGKFVNEMMLDESAGWKWLADYIVSTSASNTSILAALNSGTEVYWRYSIAAFFTASAGTNPTYTVDFSTAGQPSEWGPAYQIAHGAVLLPTYVTSAYTLPTPVHPSRYEFLGWYDNAEFAGSPLTTIPANWTGTLYAKWQEDTPTIDPTWQITYTSTDGNIVTPNDVNVFGANIVSNDYQDGQGVITFDGPVTSIGDSAFYECKSLASITIPNSVTSIGESAFSECTSLSSVTIPNSVTSIGYVAFANCTSLTSVTLGSGVTSIGDMAFCLCTSLTSITIPESVTSIGDMAFCRCDSLSSVTIPNSVTSIGDGAFANCPSLTSVTLGSGVTSIGNEAFWYCTSLTSITIPESVTSIGSSAFWYCTSLTSITIPESVTSIGSSAFWYCTSLTSVTIGSGVTSIGYEVFCYCSSLTSITIPNSVTSIGEDAFESCTSLTSITIPNSVTSIGRSAFAGCTSLTSVTIPNSVTSIGVFAFSHCTSLTSITCEATTPPTLGSDVFPSNLTTAYIPCFTLAAYEASDWASQVGSFMEDCVEGQQIYYTSTNDSIVTPYNVNAFDANIVSNIYENGVGTITFDGPVTSIGENAFRQCSSIASITIPKSVKSIGEYAFSQCSYLSSITIPDSVTRIGDWAFSFCMTLTSVTIHDSVTSIGEGAFWHCNSLTSITIPSNVTNIGSGVFGYCWNLASLVIAEGNTIYDSRDNCNAIIETTTNTLISGCQNTIILNNVTSIGAEAFYGCSSLTSIILPNSVTNIGEQAFANCSGLTSITLPNSVMNIGDQAFVHCSSLDSITLPNSVTSIGEMAFLYCSSLDTIYVEATTPPALEDSTVFMNTPAPVCVIPCGSLAAYKSSAWASQVGSFMEDCVEGQQIYYTSTDGNIVTPYATDVFGANIVSNIYENGVGTITFDGPVTTIGEKAFYQCKSLASITIPNSVTSIGKNAFDYCSSLTSITIPNSVSSIGEKAFYQCKSLTSITIPNSVTSIGSVAFANCTSLTSITIPNSVTSIGDYAFASCHSLTSITIPNSVTSIGYGAFSHCTSLTSITIPESVTSIGERAFTYCSSLTSATIGSGVTSIGNLAFSTCTSLASVTCEATTPPTLGSEVFPSELTTAYIPCGTKEAYEASDWAQYVSEFIEEGCPTFQMCGDNLFWEYADGVLTITGTGDMYDYADDKTGPAPWYDVRGSITTINMPNEMTKIGDYAFYKCTEVTSINMPTTLTAIGEKAFAQDTKLACEIILPASMTTIASRAFFNCQAVTAFHIEATTPPTIPNDAFERTTAPIHVPCGYGHIYGKHAQWGVLNLEMCELLQDNVYYYPIDGHTARAVTYHSNPTDTIVIPSAVVIDGMPRTVTEVADFAFTDCDNLPAIYFNEGLEYIGERAFVRCYGLHGTIVLPSTLETIGERAFSYCDNVEKYLIQAMTPPALGDGAFTCANHDALFYVSCEVMDDYKVAARWSSLKSRLRDACLNIYHYNTPLGTNGVYTTEDTLVASIYYRRQFTPYRWETLYLPFEVDRVTVLEDGEEYDLKAWDIKDGGHYFIAKPDGWLNMEIIFGFTDELDAHTPYIIQFKDDYYRDKIITFYGKESWNKLSTSFEVLSSSSWMQIAGNTTMQDQLLEEPVYMLRSGLDFILQKTTTTLHPFECYVMPYATPSGTPARMNVRFRGDVATAVESVKGNESHLTYIVDGYTLTVYPQGQAFSIYSLNGALIYSCEAGKEDVDCELNSGCYLLHAGAEAHKIML